MTTFDRRALLRAGAVGATVFATSKLGTGALRSQPGSRTKRLIVVAMAGGVRTRETLHTPSNVPNLMRIVERGVVYPRARATNLGHFGATLSIFTGISDARGIRDNTRGTDPTLF